MRRSMWPLLVAAIVAGTFSGRITPPDTSRVALASATTAGPTVNVTDFGAVGDGQTNDTAAIERATDHVATEGGGTVLFPAGIYVAVNVRQRSNVEFLGSPGATLKHPDGVSNLPIVRGRWTRTLGDIDAGSTTIRVSSTKDFVPGAVVGVRGAGGASAVQKATLARSMTPEDATLTFTAKKGWGSDGWNFLLVENEIVGYADLSGFQALYVVRGLFGTNAVAHPQGAPIAQLQAHYGRVQSVGDSTIELDRPAAQSVVGVDVYVGSVNMTVRGLTLDGSRVPGGAATNPVPLRYSWARNVRVTDCTIINGDHAAIVLDQGTSDSIIEHNVLRDNGTPGSKLGAGVIIFRGSTANLVRDNEIGGDTYLGVFIDDRTVGASEWDAPSSWNAVVENRIDIPSVNGNSGVYVVGSEGNEVASNNIGSLYNGIAIMKSTQSIYPVDAQLSVVHDNVLTNHYLGIWVTGSNNAFERNQVSFSTYPIVNTGTGNTFTQ